MQADFHLLSTTSTSLQLCAARGPHWHGVSFLKARGSLQANTKKKIMQIQIHVLCKVHAAATSLKISCSNGNLCRGGRVETLKRSTYTKQGVASENLKNKFRVWN